jgi:hypothetical protein
MLLEKAAITVYIHSTVYAYRMETAMEHLVRVLNERDRQTLAWLRRTVGDAAIGAAAQDVRGVSKPYLSSVCRRLGVTPPVFPSSRPSETATRAMAAIRRILAG